MSTADVLHRVADLLDPAPDAYFGDPVAWANDLIDWPPGEHLISYQADALADLAEAKRMVLRGPHGLGKSTCAALAILWFATTRERALVDWKVPTTASAWRQLTKFLWPEIHKWTRRLRWEALGREPWNARELMTLSLKLGHGEAFAAASNDPTTIEGAHAEQLLYVFDEAKAIPEPIFDAAEGAFSGAGADTERDAFALVLSTPGPPVGRFYAICSRKPGFEQWRHRHVTVGDAVEAGRISAEWAEDRRRQWGEGSALYANRVLGQFATSDEDAVIPLAWIEAAQRRWDDAHPHDDLGPVSHLGVDPSRFGEDRTVLAHRHGPVVSQLDRYDHTDTGEIAGAVEVVLRAHQRAVAIIDMGGGWGAGAYDSLKERYRQRLVGFQPAGRTTLRDRSGELEFANVRAAAWWGLRDRLDPETGSEIQLPPDDLLTGDLTAPTWKMTAGGKIQVESKDSIRERLGRSPDDGDAVVMAFYPVQRGPATISTGRSRALPKVRARR